MLSFALALNHLFRAVFKSWQQEHFRGTLALAIIVLASGTLFYWNFEGWSIVDALYFSAATAATVGYGDLAPKTTGGKLFAVVYMFISIGVFVALFSQIARTLIADVEHRDKGKRKAKHEGE